MACWAGTVISSSEVEVVANSEGTNGDDTDLTAGCSSGAGECACVRSLGELN